MRSNSPLRWTLNVSVVTYFLGRLQSTLCALGGECSRESLGLEGAAQSRRIAARRRCLHGQRRAAMQRHGSQLLFSGRQDQLVWRGGCNAKHALSCTPCGGLPAAAAAVPACRVRCRWHNGECGWCHAVSGTRGLVRLISRAQACELHGTVWVHHPLCQAVQRAIRALIMLSPLHCLLLGGAAHKLVHSLPRKRVLSAGTWVC
jgi:hypothetical protein